MRISIIGVALALLGCTSSSATPDPAPTRSLCLTELEPDLAPVMSIGPDCGDLLDAPCELAAACVGDTCTCTCEHRGDCRGTEVYLEQTYYAGQLPGWSFECVEQRCLWQPSTSGLD